MRLLTLAQALEILPNLIWRMRRGELMLYASGSPDMPELFRMENTVNRMEHWTLLREDFDRCKAISSRISLFAFPTAPRSDSIGQIEAEIAVEFADRGPT